MKQQICPEQICNIYRIKINFLNAKQTDTK